MTEQYHASAQRRIWLDGQGDPSPSFHSGLRLTALRMIGLSFLPTRAHVRLRLMRIRADKSAVGAINRPLQAWPDYFVKVPNRPLHCPDARLSTMKSYSPFFSLHFLFLYLYDITFVYVLSRW